MTTNSWKSPARMSPEAKLLADAIAAHCGSIGYRPTALIDVDFYDEDAGLPDWETFGSLSRADEKRVLRREVFETLQEYGLIYINSPLRESGILFEVRERLFDAVNARFRISHGPQRSVFICHSSADETKARAISDLISSVSNTKVFFSPYPEAIPSGRWFDVITRQLTIAKALVIVASRQSVERPWINFEYGMFYALNKPEDIHILRIEDVELPSPLNELQAKNAADEGSLRAFINTLADNLDTYVSDEPDYQTAISIIDEKSVPLEVGVLPNVVSPPEVPDGPFPTYAEIGDHSSLTLLFRNNTSSPISNVQLRISARASDGEVIRLTGFGTKHIEPETEFKSLRTTEEWTYLGPNVIHNLCLHRGHSFTGLVEPLTCTIRVQMIRSSLKRLPEPFEVTVKFLPYPPAEAIYI